MACTSHSAIKYVSDARLDLVRELKNLSVILENLYQQRVLSDEEVSKIQAEKDDYDKTRKIVDTVIRKGDAACYVFLKIIDMTRKRIVGRTPPLPEKNEFDLHQWISCFPFKDDPQMDTNYLQGPKPCYRYQAKLKAKAATISKEFWMANTKLFKENYKPDLSYVSPVLDTQGSVSPSKIKKLKSKKSRMPRPKKLRTYIPEGKPEISPSDLLKTDKNILLVGKPGIGKTALTHEMLRLWAERDNKELDYMFYFDMRETSHIMTARTLEDLLFSVFSEPDEGKDEVLQDIKRNSDNVTVILDGVTGLSSLVVEQLVKKDLLPDAKVILTCRPEDEEEFGSRDFLRVEVKGFSEQTIKTYLSAMLGENQEKVLNLELLTLCHVPMYALMVAACFSSETPDASSQPCSITEIYIHIVRFCLQMNSNKKTNKDLNPLIKKNSEQILSLAEVAFKATEAKTVILTKLTCEDRCVLSFLKSLDIKVAHTETETTCAFLHYTMQEFFAALWLLKNSDKIKDVFQQCLREEMKHMKHLIPFMCRLLSQKYPTLMTCLIPAQELKDTSNWFFNEVITTFSPHLCNQVFLCQCLYESQCPEACICFLDKLNYHLDLSEESLDPYLCCAVAYVVAQSKQRKLSLDLEGAEVSELGMRQLFGCLKNVQWTDSLSLQLWEMFLLSEENMDYTSLLGLDGNQLHLPVNGKKQLFERAAKLMKEITIKVNVRLHSDRATSVCHNLYESLSKFLPNISSLSVVRHVSGPSEEAKCFGNLFCAAAEREQQTGEKTLELLLSVCRYENFPLDNRYMHLNDRRCDFLLDLCSHVKDYETKTGLRVLPSLQSVFQSAPAVWFIDLSKRKSSILLEVLKLQPEKKQVKLRGCSDEQSEVRSFLQCLPYISQLSSCEQFKGIAKFFGNLFCAAAEREQQTGEKTLELLLSVCRYRGSPLRDKWCDFLLDLYETETGQRVLPSLQSVFQSAPAVWVIDLSKRKSSILLEVLKLQSKKKQVKLTGCSHEESEVRSFLQCLPYVSQLSSCEQFKGIAKFFGNLFCAAAAEREQQTGEKTLELLQSVCRYETFPFYNMDDDDDLLMTQSDFLLDLCSHVKDYETETGLRVLPSLQSVFQSAPAVWFIDLSERKSSILLEVLKLQPEKKQVKLTGCSDEESEVRSLLQCLPYISKLSFSCCLWFEGEAELFGNLFCAAAVREQQTGEKTLEQLLSVCRYEALPFYYIYDDHKSKYQCDFLLDLCSHVKDYETETGLRVLPSLQSVFQSAPAVWVIDLSERKSSILLEVLKLQPEKKQVMLEGCSHEESEVRSFLQCLPYISQLSSCEQFKGIAKFFGNLFCAAAEREQQTGEKTLEQLLSVCRYGGSALRDKWCDFLLDLYETKTGLRVLPSLQSVFQSAPAVWVIDLSKRKSSILLEVLKLQPEKKQVELTGCSDEESEVRSFLQCLPYISMLSFMLHVSGPSVEAKFFGNLFCAAAEREQQTGEKTLELLLSVCRYGGSALRDKWCDFLLDLCETETGLRVLPSLQSVFQPAPAVWFIDLSKRKSSILLEVLKLQPEKKQVMLEGCSDEESEVRSFLQCLPYISKLSIYHWFEGVAKLFGNLFCAAAEREQQTGEKTLELLLSVCRYENFPFYSRHMHLNDRRCDFLLDLCSHVKDNETETGLRVLPSLQSVFQSAPAVWFIDLSERKSSILLEVLKLQPEKKQVELTGCSHEESEVRSFLQCLPYISHLSFYYWFEGEAKLFGNLFCAAAEREQQTGENTLELLLSVCSYETFPFRHMFLDHSKRRQCDFLLDLYSHLKDYETETGLRVLPSLQSVFQSAPAVWFIDLSERKSSILLEVLKLQSEKKQVKLRGCSHEESEVKGFLQCLPYISQLSCDPDFFQSVCTIVCVSSREEVEQLASLLQLPMITLLLTGELPRKTCWSLGRVLGLCGSNVDLILTPRKISVRETSLLFRSTTKLHSLRMSINMALLLSQWVRRGRMASAFAVEELSLAAKKTPPSDRVLLRVVSSLASLLRYWKVTQLHLTEFSVPVQGLIPLLLHDGPLTIKLSEKMNQQLVTFLNEIQDKHLTLSFLRKVDGDLTSYSLNLEMLLYLLQQSSAQIITVNLRKNCVLEESITHLIPFLDRILFKRPSPSFVLTAIRVLHKAHAGAFIPSLLRSLGHEINLTCREMDTVDCAALLYTLKHSDRVKLNLLWTSIPTEEIQSILFTLDKVSQLSVDRNVLLRLIHCCAACGVQQGAAVSLLRALQHRLDLSCCSNVELQEDGHSESLSLTAEDCRVISTILTHSSRDTQLNIEHCEVDDSGLDLLFPVLHTVQLRASKAVLLQLVYLVPVSSERDTLRRAESLCGALGRELDLSHTTLDHRACGGLALMLELCEGLTELDLSHCQLTDHLLISLITHLHKVQVLDLSHNQITDASTGSLLQLLSINPYIHTVRLFNNNIEDKKPFRTNKKFEIW